jgi:hypothetical protein
MQVLNTIDDLPQDISICLYGAGDYGISLYRLLNKKRHDINVVCFIDSYRNNDVCGLQTINPDDLNNIEYDYVIITSHAFQAEISKILEEKEITSYYTLNPIFNSHYAVPIKTVQGLRPTRGQTLYAFYDLAVSLTGFDYTFFLFQAETTRIQKGYQFLHPVIVPPPHDNLLENGTNFEQGMSVRTDARYSMKNDWQIRNIIIPCSWLVSSCRQVTRCGSREEAEVLFKTCAPNFYPNLYSPHHPVTGFSHKGIVNALREQTQIASTFESSEEAQIFIKSWLEAHTDNKLVITITLRESNIKIGLDKNSSIEEWVAFADSLDTDVFRPVFIKDTEMALTCKDDRLKNHIVFTEIPWNMELRMALYELSHINMFVGNGPAWLCLLNSKTRCIMFSKPNAGHVSIKDQFSNAGVDDIADYPYLSPYHKIIFSNDDFKTLKKEFEYLCELIAVQEN